MLPQKNKMTRAQRNKARRKKDRSLETGRFAKKITKENNKNLLTATGKFCHELSIAYKPQMLLGNPSAHIQFFNRKTRENF